MAQLQYKCFCSDIVETNQLGYVLQKSVTIKTGSSNICYDVVNNLLRATLAERRVFSLIRPIYNNYLSRSTSNHIVRTWLQATTAQNTWYYVYVALFFISVGFLATRVKTI